MSENIDESIRPWGNYEILTEADTYKVKRIFVKPNSILSLQKHFKRAEHWIIVQGTGHVTKNEDIIEVKTNESVYLPIETIHRIENKSDSETLVFIEVQTGNYFGEDDIIRIEDNYGRTE